MINHRATTFSNKVCKWNVRGCRRMKGCPVGEMNWMEEEKGKTSKRWEVEKPVWKLAYEVPHPCHPHWLIHPHRAAMIYSHLLEMADRWHLNCAICEVELFVTFITALLVSATCQPHVRLCVLKGRGSRDLVTQMWNQTTDLLQASIRFNTWVIVVKNSCTSWWCLPYSIGFKSC